MQFSTASLETGGVGATARASAPRGEGADKRSGGQQGVFNTRKVVRGHAIFLKIKRKGQRERMAGGERDVIPKRQGVARTATLVRGGEKNRERLRGGRKNQWVLVKKINGKGGGGEATSRMTGGKKTNLAGVERKPLSSLLGNNCGNVIKRQRRESEVM